MATVLGHTQRLWPQVVKWMGVALVYGLAVRLGLLLKAQPEGIASIWPASGLSLAVLLLSSRQQWPNLLAVIFITNAAGNWTGGNSFFVSLGFALTNTLEPFLGAWVLVRFCRSQISFRRIAEVVALFGVVILCNGITALLGAAVPAIAQNSPFWTTWRVWWIADGLGIILVSPLIVVWVTHQNPLQSIPPRRMVETILLFLLLAAFAWLLSVPVWNPPRPLLYHYMIFPLLIWLAFRFSQRGMTSGLLMLAVITIWSTLQGYGYFGSLAQTMTESLFSIQIFLILTSFSGLFLRAMVTERQQAAEALLQDIAERRKAEQALRESEESLHQVLEVVPIGLWIIDKTGKIVHGNRSGRQIWAGAKHVGPEHYGEYKGWWLSSGKPIAADEWAASRAIRRGEISLDEEIEIECFDGSRKIILNSAVPLFNDQQAITGAIVVNQEITARKRAEAEKAKLEAMNRQLQKTESLSRMAGAIAHQFNNKLGAVIGNLELAMSEMPPKSEALEMLNNALESTRMAAEISSRMLTYLGNTISTHASLDLSEVCRQSLPLLQTMGTLKIDLPIPGPTIRSNVTQIQQVLVNLVINAREATAAKQEVIQLSVKMAHPHEIPSAYRFPINWQPKEITYACLEVSDKGCGINEEDIEKIFDPFFSTKFTGRGIGLPVVLGIAKAHDGVVVVESEREKRSTFRVYFPISTEELSSR